MDLKNIITKTPDNQVVMKNDRKAGLNRFQFVYSLIHQ
jgi:hypothetical protein